MSCKPMLIQSDVKLQFPQFVCILFQLNKDFISLTNIGFPFSLHMIR
ncbi:Uncharacterised protein [uncultured Blautia sp.]|nr:Uncharacterised protein [uncultured Blautia sp.]